MEKQLKELTAKIDKILEQQELILSKLNQGTIIIDKPATSAPTVKKLTKKEEENLRIEQFKEDIRLSLQYGGALQRQFNLAVQPNIKRIRAYLTTRDESAFDGLKRNK